MPTPACKEDLPLSAQFEDHTPLPWTFRSRYDEEKGHTDHAIYAPDGKWLARVRFDRETPKERQQANMELITVSTRAHEPVTEVLEMVEVVLSISPFHVDLASREAVSPLMQEVRRVLAASKSAKPAIYDERRAAGIDASEAPTLRTDGHWPLPWCFAAQGDANEYCFVTQDGRGLADVRQNGEMLVSRQQANLALMDLATRSHGPMVAALEMVERELARDPIHVDPDTGEAISPLMQKIRWSLRDAKPLKLAPGLSSLLPLRDPQAPVQSIGPERS